MKKSFILIVTTLLLANVSNAQFGNLLNKIKGKKTDETSKTETKTEEPVKKKGSSKKSGNFLTVWEAQFENKTERIAMVSWDGKIVIGSDDNSASVLDGDGKPIWDGDYKKITTNKTNKCEKQFVVFKEGGGYLFLFDSRSLGKDRVACLDIKTGKELWNSEEYQDLIPKGKNEDNSFADDGELETVKFIFELNAFLISQRNSVILVNADSGAKLWETTRFKGGIGKYIYSPEKNEIVLINFKPTALGALFSGFKNQIVRINASNGELIWETTFRGTIEKELVTRRAIVEMWLKKDKLFLNINGLMVFDYATGKPLWEATFETDVESKNTGSSLIGGKKRTKLYRTIADPIYTNDAVYLVILGNRDKTKYIEKHDINSGKLLWTSEKITGALAIPNVYKAGNKILMQIGGKVQVQELRWEEATNSTASAIGGLGGFGRGGGAIKTWVPYIYSDYRAQKNGVLAIDDATGATSWRSEKFDKRITDLIIDNDKTLFVGDGDEFYGYDIANGNQLFDVKHNDAKVGKATDVIDFNDKVVVISEKGLAAYFKKDGTRVYATEKLRGIDSWYNIKGNFFLRDQRNSKNIIHGINMETGETKGSVQSRGKGGNPQFGDGIDITKDGEFIYAFKGKKVEKIKVNN
ncbi:MAG: PQQ-binding-like beta-propeller repeat protein [Flavobacterium sp.]|nr:PQQ-binding-like beta-propeller repeat protein [Flavobacterium sp.]